MSDSDTRAVWAVRDQIDDMLALHRFDDDGCPPALIPPASIAWHFKLGCVVRGEPDRVHYNALVFASEDECEDYGKDLYSRWMMLERYVVTKTLDPVTYRMVDGHAYSIASLEDRSNG